MNEILEKILLIIGGGGLTTLIMTIANKRKTGAEASKILTEDKKLAQDKEITLVKFYREQVENLTKSYEILSKKFEEKENENVDCEFRLNQLEQKYNAILSKINLLEKNIKS